MIDKVFIVGVTQGSTFVVDGIDSENFTVVTKYMPITKINGVEFDNFSSKGEIMYNGRKFSNAQDLIRAVGADTGKWLLVNKLTGDKGEVIGYGMLNNHKYYRLKTEDAMKVASNCVNAFVRDGVLVNKTKETSEVSITSTVKPAVAPKPVEEVKPVIVSPVAPVNINIPNNNSGTVTVNVPKVSVAAPVVPLVNKNDSQNVQSGAELDGKAAIDRMKELIEKLNEAARVYEQGDDEIMSNFEYDQMYDELMKLEGRTGTILSNSPTQKVGYEVLSNLEKKEHETPMLSLGKTKEVGDLATFLGQKEGVLSWKLDGLTVVLTYNNGVLEQAVTRGNGYIGELVTNNAKTFVNLPKKISRVDKIVLRAEALISYADFEKIKATPEGAEYKNARNLCSGSVRQLDSAITAKRNVRAVVFDWVNAPSTFTKEQQLDFIKGLGFETVQSLKVDMAHIADAVNAFKKIIDKMPYPSDGLVLTYNDVAYGKSLGNTAKTPRHSIAFKWQDEEAETTLEYIDWTVGRSGVVTPTAVFKPVDLEGTTVTRASLHNLSILEQVLGNPYKGQKIWVYKANMIIPQISRAEKVQDILNLTEIGTVAPMPMLSMPVAPVRKPAKKKQNKGDIIEPFNDGFIVTYMGDEIYFDTYDEAQQFVLDNMEEV